ncbi:MAG: hypothetical protein VXW22_17145 [Pseudomonadota bacterium]|nr:hypothetical protein [Pseudomonadota bacterium]
MTNQFADPLSDGWTALSPHEDYRNLVSFCSNLTMMHEADLAALYERLAHLSEVEDEEADRAFLKAAAERAKIAFDAEADIMAVLKDHIESPIRRQKMKDSEQ